jgi:hypothetical protein
MGSIVLRRVERVPDAITSGLSQLVLNGMGPSDAGFAIA